MSALWRDLALGMRRLLRAPAFTAAAVATLALGIGANGAIFSVVRSTLLYPVPWRDPGRLVALEELHPSEDGAPRGVSSAKLRDWREQARSFAELAAVRPWGFRLGDRDGGDLVDGAHATPNAFSALGLRLALGRGLVAADAEADAGHVVVISHGLWERRFACDPGILGRPIELDDETAAVVGVLAPDEWFPWPWSDLVVPLRLHGERAHSRTDHSLFVVGALAPDASASGAQIELDVVAARLAASYPDTDGGWRVRVRPIRDVFQERTRRGVIVLMAAVTAVLLIACANVAALLLARATSRQRELAIRSAVGASRAQIVRQLLGEATALALLALPFAWLVTRACLDAFLGLVPPSVTFMHQFFRFDAAVAGFATAIALASVLAFGLGPALDASRVDLGRSLGQGGQRGATDGGRARLRALLAAGQIALALPLLVGSGLLIQSFGKLQAMDPGFPRAGLLTTSFVLPAARYTEHEHWRAAQRAILARVAALPGVVSAATAASLPFGFDGEERSFAVEGGAAASRGETPRARWSNPSPGYAATLGQRIVAGRSFDARDTARTGCVAIVNEALVRRALGESDPLRARLRIEERSCEIVGVVSNVKQRALGVPISPEIYEPFEQQPTARMNLLIRTDGAPLALANAVRREIAAFDPEIPTVSFLTMDARIERSLWQTRFLATVMTALGLAALALAAVGVYGLFSYSAALRTREFGIRLALGAEPAWVALLVLRQVAVLTAIGIAVGAVLSMGLAGALRAVLYEVDAWQPLRFGAQALLLAGVALVAGALPALRAARVDPMAALRVD